jgi:methyl-accepting chemotaxis protein
MKDMSVLKKFYLMAGLVGVVLLLQAALTLKGMSTLDDGGTQIAAREVPILNRAHDLKLSVVQVQQWLTDISATRGRDGLDDGFVEAENNANHFRALVAELVELDSENSARYEGLLAPFEAYYETGRRMAQAYIDEGPDGGNKMMGEFDEVAAGIASKADVLLADTQQRTAAVLVEQEGHINSAWRVFVVSALLVAVVVGFMSYIIWHAMRRLSPPVAELKRVAKGDLSGAEIAVANGDEIGQLCMVVNEMRDKLRGILSQVNNASSHVSATASEVSLVTQQSNQAVERQRGDLDQLATAMNEMSATAHEIASNAATASEKAKNSDEAAAAGKTVVGQTMAAINQLAQEVASTAEVIGDVAVHSDRIGGVLEVIRGIAEQTNLLALNAAIEAARAGEQGRGFAVVADEVRNLAQRTQESTKEIEDMVDRLQRGARQAVEVMERGRSQAEESIRHATNAGSQLENITRAVSAITDMNHQIATAAEEQSAVTEEMNRNVVGIQEMANQISTGMGQTAASSQRLNQQTVDLTSLVERFVF